MSRTHALPAKVGVMVAILAALIGSGLTVAAPQERAELRAERNRLTEAFSKEERACSLQFLVTACQDEVRARRREALAPVRERELRLDEAERQAKTEQRRRAIAAKQALAASQPAARPAPPVRVRSSALAASVPTREPRQQDNGDRASAAASRARELEVQRQQAVQAQHRVDRREAERLAAGRKAVPLPTPAQAASSARGP